MNIKLLLLSTFLAWSTASAAHDPEKDDVTAGTHQNFSVAKSSYYRGIQYGRVVGHLFADLIKQKQAQSQKPRVDDERTTK